MQCRWQPWWFGGRRMQVSNMLRRKELGEVLIYIDRSGHSYLTCIHSVNGSRSVAISDTERTFELPNEKHRLLNGASRVVHVDDILRSLLIHTLATRDTLESSER